MINVEVSPVINRPVEEVFAFMVDIKKRPQWISEGVEEHWTPEGPVGVGSTFRTVRRFMGRGIETERVVTEYEPDRKFTYKTTGSRISVEVSTAFEEVPGGTKVNVLAQGGISGVFKITEPLFGRAVKRVLKAELGNFKNLLEAHAEG